MKATCECKTPVKKEAVLGPYVLNLDSLTPIPWVQSQLDTDAQEGIISTLANPLDTENWETFGRNGNFAWNMKPHREVQNSQPFGIEAHKNFLPDLFSKLISPIQYNVILKVNQSPKSQSRDDVWLIQNDTISIINLND